ncbi:MAG: hypothetical protein JNK04_17535, partial [Myxococcales bacterium]|nr:hypothetical protein [Myxococcales bacterium]
MKKNSTWYRDEYVMVRAVDRAAPFAQPVSLGDPEVVLGQLADALPNMKTGPRVTEAFGKSHASWEAGFVDDRYDVTMEMTLIVDPTLGAVGISVTVAQGYGRAGPEDGSHGEV